MISPEEAANKLTSAVFANLFKQQKATVAGKEVQYYNPSKNKDQFLVSIKTAITKAIESLKKDHPNLRVPGSDAVKGYTARVLANAGEFITDVVQTKTGMVAPVSSSKDLKVAIVKAEAPKGKVEQGNDTEDVFVRTNAKFIADFQKVFVEIRFEIFKHAIIRLKCSPFGSFNHLFKSVRIYRLYNIISVFFGSNRDAK
jgi:hypothetical protein